MSELLDSALIYFSRGWKVIQLHYIKDDGACSCRLGLECKPGTRGKHPVMEKWQSSEPLTEKEIRQLWSEADWNIGIATGPASGFWVLDIDPENGGFESWSALVSSNSDIEASYSVRTGSGGVHYYFSMPDFPVTNSRGRLPKGIDVRGDGGQVVAPPSRSGKGEYVTATNSGLVPAPRWLLDLIRPTERPKPDLAAPTSGRLTPVIRGGIERELARLDEMRTLARPDGRGYSGPPWDATCFEIACNLIELCNEAGGYHDQAHYQFAARAPRDAGFTSARIEDKWASAERKIGEKARGWGDLGSTGFGPATSSAPYVAPMPTPAVSHNAGIPRGTEAAAPGVNAEVIQFPAQNGAQGAPAAAGEGDEWGAEALAAPEGVQAPSYEEMVDSLIAEMLTSDQLDDIPPLQPLIEGFLSLDTIARINGPSGHGKSFVALDMAMSVATGRRWHGNGVTSGAVIYLVAEGGSGIRQRVRAWEREYLGGAKAGQSIRFLPRPVQANAPEWGVLIEACKRLKPLLIVVDTQARITVGMEENSATEMGLLVHNLEALRASTQACVLLIHHEGKTERGGRGSSAVKGAMQTELSVAREEGRVLVGTDKQKDGAELPDVELRTKLIVLAKESDEADAVTSLVMVDSDAGWSAEELAAGVQPAEDGPVREQLESSSSTVFNRALGGTQAQHRTVLDEARRRAGQSPVSKTSFYRAWGDLVETGAFARIAGTSSYRWLPPAKRADLLPVEKGKGYYAPSEDEGGSGDPAEDARRRLANQRSAVKASGVDVNEVVE